MKEENETWLPVPSFPGLLASSLGRLMISAYKAPGPRGGLRTLGGKPTFGTWGGRRYHNRFRGHTIKVARIICEAFHGPAPIGAPLCLHIDENAKNNRPENLKWGTAKENLNAPGYIAHCKSRVGALNPHAIGIRKKKEIRL